MQVAASLRFSPSHMGMDLHMARPTAVHSMEQSTATRHWVCPLREAQAGQGVAQGTALVVELEEEAPTMSHRHPPTPFLNLRGLATFPLPGPQTAAGLIIPNKSKRRSNFKG